MENFNFQEKTVNQYPTGNLRLKDGLLEQEFAVITTTLEGTSQALEWRPVPTVD